MNIISEYSIVNADEKKRIKLTVENEGGGELNISMWNERKGDDNDGFLSVTLDIQRVHELIAFLHSQVLVEHQIEQTFGES